MDPLKWFRHRPAAPDQFPDLTLVGMYVYLEDEPGTEEIEYQSSPELHEIAAVLGGSIPRLQGICKRHPASADPAVLLAQNLCFEERAEEAEAVLKRAIGKVKYRSRIAASFGKLYLFYKKDILLSLVWLLRSIIAQRKNPYYESPYLYFSTFLSVLNSKYLVFEKETAEAERLGYALSDGQVVNREVWRDIDIRLSELPSHVNSQIVDDLGRVFDALKLFR
jgi:hypothetical protein